MASSSILDSKYFNKLQVNRLEANDIKSDNIIPGSISYLFSGVFDKAKFDRNETGGTLTITKDNTESIIQFSDRPFRKTENIDFNTFVSLFDTSGIDSFQELPPNCVLTHDEEQKTYIIKLLSSDFETATFSLELLPGETHNLTMVEGRMNLFVDNDTPNFLINTIIYNSSTSGSSKPISTFSYTYNAENNNVSTYKKFYFILLKDDKIIMLYFGSNKVPFTISDSYNKNFYQISNTSSDPVTFDLAKNLSVSTDYAADTYKYLQYIQITTSNEIILYIGKSKSEYPPAEKAYKKF